MCVFRVDAPLLAACSIPPAASCSMPSEDQLTVLEDKVILIISSLGLVLISAVVFWVARQSSVGGVRREEEGEAGLLGGRTRVVPGGREALKAARKEAKKRAKAEFKESTAGLKRRSRVHEVRICMG